MNSFVSIVGYLSVVFYVIYDFKSGFTRIREGEREREHEGERKGGRISFRGVSWQSKPSSPDRYIVRLNNAVSHTGRSVSALREVASFIKRISVIAVGR